jgi:AsmA family protein
MARPRSVRLLGWIGIPLGVIAVLVAVVLIGNWSWFIPLVQSRAATALGRPVTIGRLHGAFTPNFTVTAEDIVVANPAGWPEADPPLAAVKRLTIQADLWRFVTGGGLTLPVISVDQPAVYAAEQPDGRSNFSFPAGDSGGASPRIGTVEISDGTAHVVAPTLKADFKAELATRTSTATGENAEQIVATAKGTYAGQPIDAHLVGGALLSLRDTTTPWPIDLNVANGPTKVHLKGTIQDPVALAGADLQLAFSGPNMRLLAPLVGFPIPDTPKYEIAGRLDLAGFKLIKFQDFTGRMGNSDIGGAIQVEPLGKTGAGGKAKPVVTLDLRSNRVDLADLSGFVGGTPDKPNTSTPNTNSKVLPDTPISIPNLNWADIHLNYKGEHIINHNVPLDSLVARFDIVDGRIVVHPVSFAVGKGRLLANADIAPASDKAVHTKLDVRLQNIDVSRLMAATHTFEGSGLITGVGAFDGTGTSVATLLGSGNGEVKMAMAGGDLSAVLVDLSGLEFGNALLSALGIPQKTPIECFIGDLELRRGILDFQAMTLQTKEALVNVGGSLSFAQETLDLNLKTDARHFSIGSLPTSINVTGPFKHPSIRPGVQVVARAGAVVGLGVLFVPLALLPTIQFGTSAEEDAKCGELLAQARNQAGGKALAPPQTRASEGQTPR